MRCGFTLLSVVLVATLAACSSGKSEPPPPPELLPPTAMKAEADGMAASLTWGLDPKSAKVEKLVMFRNGTRLFEFEPDRTDFVDTKIQAGKEYTYELRADGGGKQSETASATITIDAPPLAEARLEGFFRVRTKILEEEGYSRPPKGGIDEWKFTPKCKEGACAVEWLIGAFNAHGKLNQKGVTYKGKTNTKFNSRCSGQETVSHVEITWKVMQARAMHGEWIATKLRGRMNVTDPPQLGCLESHHVQAMTADFKG